MIKRVRQSFMTAAAIVGVMLFLAPLSAAQTTPAKSKTEPKSGKTASHKKESKAALEKEAKITLDEAKAIALKKAPGTIKEGELEREKGKLVYSFDIQTGKEITEVQVNAIDGTIVSVEKEDARKEAAEKKKEAKEKSTSGQKK